MGRIASRHVKQPTTFQATALILQCMYTAADTVMTMELDFIVRAVLSKSSVLFVPETWKLASRLLHWANYNFFEN